MVDILTGNLFESPAQTLVNTVNCVGVMGKGIAKQFRDHYPAMFKEYKNRCDKGLVKLGEPYLYRNLTDKWVLNFPTKDHWRSVSKLTDIQAGLQYLELHYKAWGIESLAVPPLGCGNGQLDWKVVGPILHEALQRLDIPVYLYAPSGTPAVQLTKPFLSQGNRRDDIMSRSREVTAAHIAVVAVLAKHEVQKVRYPVGRTSFQKLVYFVQEAGIPLDLQFEKGSYGPHSSDLNRFIATLQNNGLVTEQKRGQMFHIQVGPSFKSSLERYRNEIADWSSELRRVFDLFHRMNTSDAELAASVHFAATHILNVNASEMDVVQQVDDWKNKQNRKFPKDQVADVVRHLNVEGWIDAEYSPRLSYE